MVLLLMVVLLNSATTSKKQNQIIETPRSVVSRISEALPEVETNSFPRFSREHHSQFTPTVYRDATKITFSNGISFDTKYLGKGGEPALPKDLRCEYQSDNPRYYIVQFDGPIYQVQRDWLTTNSATIHFYIPHYGFVCSIEKQTSVDNVRNHPLVNWVGLYHPAYKISALFDRVGAEHKVTILLFMDADISTILDEIKTITKRADFSISDNGINKIIQGVISKNDVDVLAKIHGIYWIEPYIQPHTYNNNVQWIVQDAEYDVRNIWAKGIAGEGEIVSSMDSGINCNHYAHRSGSSALTTWGYYPTHNAIVAYDSGGTDNIVFGDGGVYHGTHTAGTMTGDDTLTAGSSNRDGVAKKSKIYFLDIGPNTGQYVYPMADLNDAFIKCYDRYYPPTRAHNCSNSWGGDVMGAYTADALSSDQFMWAHKDFLLYYSNGNAGGTPGGVGSPASAKNCVSVGGVGNGSGTQYTQYYTTTSRGPTEDGRLKPTILTPAQSVYSSTSGSSNYGSLSGTSMASPSAAGAGALIRQYLREGWYPTGKKTDADSFPFISASLVKAILINCADPNVSSYTVPDNNIGWGRVDLDSTLFFAGEARKTLLVDNTVGLLTGERVDYHFNVPAGAANLKIAVVWTDYPGNPAVLRQIVNDLNLSAYSSAHHYHGNQYSSGQSIQDPTAWDSINVEECIRVNTPTGGDWRVSVEGRNVAIGPQPYSLVITYNGGAVAGVVSLDKPGYTANEFMIDTVRIRVEDTNYGLATAIDSAMVVVNGDIIESQPESLWCKELAESAYVFKGQIPLLFNKPVHGDGHLSVAQGDTITVTYTDANPAFTTTTWAGVDASHFTISEVHCENIGADMCDVCWMTSKNTNSTVHYGTDPGNLNQTAAIESLYCIPHRVRVAGLNAKTTYYYDVESEDFYGNWAHDDNGGQHYSFTTKPAGSAVDILVALLDGVDKSTPDGQALPDLQTRFQKAVETGGWSYVYWATSDHNGELPSRDEMKNYKAVYAPSEDEYPPFLRANQETIKVYQENGGRIALSSFDILWHSWDNSDDKAYDTLWCKNYLQARFIYDIAPNQGWYTLYGMTGDVVSGDYTAGVSTYNHRTGAGADELVAVQPPNGWDTGTSDDSIWRWNNATTGRLCATRWESTNNHGTSGDGVWGGHKTRVLFNAFTSTQIDTALLPEILNKEFIWLIGHDHPDATLSSPSGGATYTSSPLSIEWNTTAHGGASIDSTWVEYSPDGGQTWIEIASGTGVSSPYSWDVSSIQNNGRYRVKVIVSDKNVYPSMKGFDETDNFTIAIPGNDNLGPRVIPQTIAVANNPMIVTTTNTSMSLNAVVSDSFSGLSNIMAAEWSTGGEPASSGDGRPMNAQDGSFDEIQEIVAATIQFEYIPGETEVCSLWVRGRDASSLKEQNWGEALMRTFTVIDGNAIGISEAGEAIPLSYALSSPLPNPFLNHVAIRYGVPRTKKVQLKIYNYVGQLVKTLVDGTVQPGFYTVHWNGKDNINRKVSAGIYFYRFSTDEYSNTKKMVMIK